MYLRLPVQIHVNHYVKEFCELLVRVLVEIFIKKGLNDRTVDDYIYEFLGTVIYPLCCNEGLRDPFTAAFYTDVVSVPLTSSAHIDEIWSELNSKSNNKVQVLHVIAYCKEVLRGVELQEDVTTTSLLQVIYPSLVTVTDDLSPLANYIDKSDFYEIICRIISCELWIHGKPVPTPEVAVEDGSSNEVKVDVVVTEVEDEVVIPLETRINKRLQLWFNYLTEKKSTVAEVAVASE